MYLTGFSFITNKSVWLDFLSGVGITLSVSLFGVLLGIIVGFIIALGRLSSNKVLNFLATTYINIYRGTPLLLQLYIMYYGVTDLIGYNIEPLLAGVIAIGLNSAAYVAEIYRAGIQSIDKGQTEAARSLGFNKIQTMKLIILPQATKNILPALANEFIVIIKETAIVSVISLKDITFYAKQIGNTTYDILPPLIIAGAIYFVLVMGLTKIVEIFERKLQND